MQRRVLAAAEHVFSTLPYVYLESHFSRAMVLELKATGHTVVSELHAPSYFTASDGSRHCICNDRLDIYITVPEKTILELKKCSGSQKQIDDACCQLRRYAINMKTSGMPLDNGFVVLFTPSGPIVLDVDVNGRA